MATRIVPSRVLAPVALLGVLLVTPALAGDIYRCQVNGVTTFVDSPSRCPEGGAQRQGVEEPKATLPARRVAKTSVGAGMATAGGLQSGTQLALPPAVSTCQKLEQSPTRLRECLREERRAEVRKIASARLLMISRATTDFLGAASRSGSVIATSNKGRPAVWCEGILGDLISGKNIDVVDDESAGGPEWVQSGGPGRSAAPILDPNFQEWRLAGEKVPSGYVTARWRASDMVVLRIVAACTEADDGTARCVPQRYTSIYVYGAGAPEACDVTVVARAYWPNWKNSMTPIFTGRVAAVGTVR